MKRSMPTLLVVLVMLLYAGMYWMDLSYFSSLQTGYPQLGEVWMRYASLALPCLMVLLGMFTIGPHGISTLRMRSKSLAVPYFICAGFGFLLALYEFAYAAFTPLLPFVFSALFYGLYGLFFLFCGLQLLVQNAPCPTKNVWFGMISVLPFLFLAVQDILFSPFSLSQFGPTVSAFATLFVLLWFLTLLRAFYIALPLSRMCFLYSLGLLVFLFATCLALPYQVHNYLFGPRVVSLPALLESINLAILGVCTACTSLSIASQSDAPEKVAKRLPTTELP